MTDDHDREDRFGALSAPGAIQPEGMHWSMWLVHLYLRPKQFFETFALRSVPPLTVLTSWLFGMGGVIDRIETRVLLSHRQEEVYAAIRSSWGIYWAVVVVLGALGGAFFYGVGGWWYKVRVRWSGAAEPDMPLVRRVYIYSAQTWAVPALFYALWETHRFDSPVAAAQATDIASLVGAWAVVLAVYWSVYVSYRGVRTVFPVRLWLARLWFGILPTVVYTLALVGVTTLFFLRSERPDIHNRTQIERQAFSLEYPANWEVDLLAEDYDPDRSFSIGPVFADAAIQFYFYEDTMDSEECVDWTVGNLEEQFELGELTELLEWGPFRGFGYQGDMILAEGKYRVLTFCATDNEPPFEILKVVDEGVLAGQQPGFDLIRDSLALRATTPGAVE